MTAKGIGVEQIERAVSVGLDAGSSIALRQEALQFFETVKHTADGFEAFLEAFAQDSPPKLPNVRFVCLQAVEDVLVNRPDLLDARRLQLCRAALWDYVTGSRAEQEESFILNKAAHVVVLLGKLQYPNHWPSFFADLINGEKSANKLHAVEFFCRVCLSLDDEIANPLISRSAKDTASATQFKDAMRQHDVGPFVRELLRLLGLYSHENAGIAGKLLHILGLYASWIDKQYLFTESFVQQLFAFMQAPALQIEACFCLTEMVGKGMSASERLSFIQALNMPQMLAGFRLDSADFTVAVAKLVNTLGTRLCESYLDLPLDVSEDISRKSLSEAECLLFPYLLQFLGHELDQVSQQVCPYVECYLKLEKKRQRQTWYAPNPTNWTLLLQLLLRKMELPDDFELEEDAQEPTEVETEAMEQRKIFKSMVDGIIALDGDLYESCVASFIKQVLDSKGAQLPPLELALYCLFTLGEGKPLVAGKETKLTQQLTAFFSRPLDSFLSNGLVSLHYFEIVVRYVSFLDMFPEHCAVVMQSFQSGNGLYNPSIRVRVRVMYLFSRFLKSIRHRYSAPAVVEQCLESLQRLLYVQVPSNSSTLADENPTSNNKAYLDPAFEAQLYIFESVGLLVDQETISADQLVAYVQTVLNPLLQILQSDLSSSDLAKELGSLEKSGPLLLQMHHAMTACGSFAKGFDPKRVYPSSVCECFQTALKACLYVLEQCLESQAIREASRYTFQRLIPVLGAGIVPYFQTLASTLFSGNSMQEILDLLPSLELLMHKYPKETLPVLDALLKPITERLFALFNAPVQGTDDERLLVELKKAFLNLIIYTFANNLDAVLVSDLNRDLLLATILEAVRHLALGSADPHVQKGAFMVYARMTENWCAQVESSERVLPAESREKLNGLTKKEASSMEDLNCKLDDADKQLAGFDQYVCETVVRTAFEVPLSKEFKLTDGGAFLVISEIVTLHRVILRRLGTRYLTYLSNVFLPQIGVDQASAEQFANNLISLDSRAFRTYLIQFFNKFSK